MNNLKSIEHAIGSIGILNFQTVSLLKLAVAVSKSDESQIRAITQLCLDQNISQSAIYHAIMSLTDVVALHDVMKAVLIADSVINCFRRKAV